MPGAPQALSSGAGTTSSQIEVTWSALATEAELGGVVGEVVITSYELTWDAGDSTGPWIELEGYSSAYTGTTFTTNPSLPA